MKILFINPYIYDFSAFDLWLRPLGLLYVAATVQKYTDCEIFWIDTLDRFQPQITIQTGITKTCPSGSIRPGTDGRGKFHREIIEKPDIYKKVPRNFSRYGIPLSDFKTRLSLLPEVDYVFMTSLMTYWVDGIRFTLECIRERFPRARVILGGILPTLIAEKSKNFIPVDHIIAGYGEGQVLDFLRKKKVQVRPHPDFRNIDNIPFPAHEFLANPKILPLMTSRGCPFACTYCATRFLNPEFLERSPQSVLEEISRMSRHFHPEHFIIFDDALLVNQEKRFKKIFSRIEPETGARFHTPNGLHPREIREETAELLFQSGFKTIRLSFESIKPEILSRSSYKVNIEDMEEAVIHLEKAGYERKEIEAYILFGIPGQSRKDVEETLSFVRQLGVVPHLSFFSPVPGTVDFLNLQKKGVLSIPLNLLETNKTYFIYQKSGLSHEDIQSIKELSIQIAQQNKK